MSEISETSPLMVPDGSVDNDKKEFFPVLFELIGARNIPSNNMEIYCVVQYGPRTIHRTKPFSPRVSRTSRISQALFMNRLFAAGSEQELLQRSLRDPIWTVQEDSLFTYMVSPKDISNKKSVKITLWGRAVGTGGIRSRRKGSDHQLDSIGKIRIPAHEVLEKCNEERIEVQLVNELGNPISDDRGEPSLLAFRCRLASKADFAFVDHWKQVPRPKHWRETDIIQEPDLPRAKLLTERPEQEVHALAPGIRPVPPPLGYVRIKPYPDPQARPEHSRFITEHELKMKTRFSSQNWVQAGSKASSIGRLYLEILSAHGLPNVDIGGSVGNETDAFCTAVYGDAMVQTDIIYDELSPHWPCWSQRAFIFHMQHPSQVLYLAVFGFKRSPLAHRAIGRVEVNPTHFRNQVVHNLEYDLCGASHASQRQSQGRIRIRVWIEMDSERRVLLKALQLPPPVYINTTKRKSMAVARYTACGEYDNQARFSLPVLQGYIDEIVEGYIRRILYSLQDGVRSLIFWRNQVHVWGVGIPLYSLLAFCMGLLLVERPRLIPAILSFMLALILLEQMQERLASPSPWRRCFSFSHYLLILVLGSSGDVKETTIPANQGAEEQNAKEEAMRQRIKNDKDFIEKKEAVQKQIEELESFKVHNNSQIIPVELMVVLGKVQEIVGNVCRICRLVDAILTWEESDVAFWITLGLLLVGTIFIFIPWGFLLKWAGRILVVLCLGPQNKVLDLVWYRKLPTNEQRIYQLFASRMFEARCKQEEAGKLKSFRHILYGKYATWVPPLFWSPHQDFPLPPSTAYRGASKVQSKIDTLPLVPGQQLHGRIIPRPEAEWRRNAQESADLRGAVNAALKEADQAETNDSSQKRHGHTSSISYNTVTLPSGRRESSTRLLEEGFEISDLYDEEAGFVQSVLTRPSSSGEESVNPADELRARYDGKSVHDFDDHDDKLNASESSDDDGEGSTVIQEASLEPVRIPSVDRGSDHQSMIELGFEMADSLDQAEEAMEAFAKLSQPKSPSPSKQQISSDVETPSATATTTTDTNPISTIANNSKSTNSSGVVPKKSTQRSALARNEAWSKVNSDLTGIQIPPKGDSRTEKEEDRSSNATQWALAGIPHSPTILDADKEDSQNDEESGFEVVEYYD